MARKFVLVALIIVVAVVAAGLLLVRDRSGDVPAGTDQPDERVGESSGAATESADAVPGAAADDTEETLTTMTLDGGGVSLSYPASFDLAVNQDQLLLDTFVPVCDDGFDYCLYLAADTYQETNFDGAGMRIEVREDLDHQAACVLEQPDGHSGLEPVLEGASDHVTALFDEVGQGAAGHLTNGALYRLYYGRTCYEFESRISQAQFENVNDGAVARFEETDLAALEADFSAMIGEVSLPDGRDQLWSQDDASAGTVGTARLLVAQPAPDAAVRSPIELSGEARGSWFFEGSFPFRLQTDNGDVLASGAVQAEGDWMTTDFVPFSATIEFDVESRTAGSLVLMNDNPSGLPENDAAVTLALELRP